MDTHAIAIMKRARYPAISLRNRGSRTLALVTALSCAACVTVQLPRGDSVSSSGAPAPAAASRARADTLAASAAALLRAGDTTAAIAAYRLAMAADPTHAAAGSLITTLYDAGHTHAALALGAHYRQHGPRNPRALFRYGWALGYTWQVDKAEAVFRELIGIDSGGIYEGWGHGELAYLARARGNAAEAIRQMELAILARPDDQISRVGLATMLLDAGRPHEAIPLLELALSRDTLARGYGQLPAQLLLGSALAAVGDTIAGRALLARLEPRMRNFAPSRRMQLYLAQGRREDALSLAQQTPVISLYGGPEPNDRLLAPLLGEPRYEALLARSRASIDARRRELGLRAIVTAR